MRTTREPEVALAEWIEEWDKGNSVGPIIHLGVSPSPLLGCGIINHPVTESGDWSTLDPLFFHWKTITATFTVEN